MAGITTLTEMEGISRSSEALIFLMISIVDHLEAVFKRLIDCILLVQMTNLKRLDKDANLNHFRSNVFGIIDGIYIYTYDQKLKYNFLDFFSYIYIQRERERES